MIWGAQRKSHPGFIRLGQATLTSLPVTNLGQLKSCPKGVRHGWCASKKAMEGLFQQPVRLRAHASMPPREAQLVNSAAILTNALATMKPMQRPVPGADIVH